LNARFYPLVFEDGSVGASGDLLPLAHISLAAIGEGEVVRRNGKRVSAAQWLSLHSISPLTLEPKEGLSLLNGTSYSTAIAALAVYDLAYLFRLTIAIAGLAAEALRCVRQAFDPQTHYLKGHYSERLIAAAVRAMLYESSLPFAIEPLRRAAPGEQEVSSGREVPRESMIQDAYSVRAIPQGFGIFLDELTRARSTIEVEANAVSDNPLIDVERRDILQGANFMATRITDACDKLKPNLAYAAKWLHALLARLTNDVHSKGLPRNLIRDYHSQNGLREFSLAVSDLAAAIEQSAFPSLVTTMSTENDNQDVVTMAPRAALVLRQNVERYRRILAYMTIAVAQALELRGLEAVGSFGREFVLSVRSASAFIERDRAFYRDVEALTRLIEDRALPVPELAVS
jgi:phenylalanine ammonia-lyase